MDIRLGKKGFWLFCKRKNFQMTKFANKIKKDYDMFITRV